MPIVSDLQLTITPATELYSNLISDSEISFCETTGEGRKAVVLDFNNGDGLYARDLGTIFQWNTTAETSLYVWQPSIIPQPETTYDRATDWDAGGHEGAKYVQGVIVEANSFDIDKVFFLQDSDTLTLHSLNECPATFNQQSEIAFSCETPFVAHSVRLISSDGVAWQLFGNRLVFQPWPELCFNWQTEQVSLGMVGWAHAREMNIPYISTTLLTLVLSFDAWPVITLTLPSSGSAQVKTKVTLPVNKWKLMGLRIYSTAAFRLFEGDVELKVKQWGSTEAFRVLKPFGGKSRVGALV